MGEGEGLLVVEGYLLELELKGLLEQVSGAVVLLNHLAYLVPCEVVVVVR